MIYETDEWENRELTIDGIAIEAKVHIQGWYSSGDSWGYGCEPPDGEDEITEVEVECAYNEETGEDVEITEELKQKVMKEVA